MIRLATCKSPLDRFYISKGHDPESWRQAFLTFPMVTPAVRKNTGEFCLSKQRCAAREVQNKMH